MVCEIVSSCLMLIIIGRKQLVVGGQKGQSKNIWDFQLNFYIYISLMVGEFLDPYRCH